MKKALFMAYLFITVMSQAQEYSFVPKGLKIISMDELMMKGPPTNLDLVYYEDGTKTTLEEVMPKLMQRELLPKMYVDEKGEYKVLVVVTKVKRLTGTVSPNFELNDINGNLVSLNSLKGNLVYIDIWATWCAPCIKEIPALKKTEKYFEGKKIKFVSICALDKKVKWAKMVAKKQLGGIQLFAPDDTITFFKHYSLDGIPRFILIDKNGKLIDEDAKRPSDPSLNKEIEKYLKAN